MEVGNRVREKYLSHKEGVIVRIIGSEINPYCIMVVLDKEKVGNNFKPEHLEVINND